MGGSRQGGPADPQSARKVAGRLLAEALERGVLPAHSEAQIRAFDAGNTALFVGEVSAALSVVVKVDDSPALVGEAETIQRAAADPRLPGCLREALPRVFAVAPDGPPFGYLMECLMGYEPLSGYLMHPARRLDVAEVLARVWVMLAEAYRATRSDRVLPNIAEDYVSRIEPRLRRAAEHEPLLGAGRPVRVIRGGQALELGSWPEVLERARDAAAGCAPQFSTFIHGDLNPENIMVRAFGLKLIDWKDYWTGDYLLDVAKIGHYLRVQAPVEAGALAAPAEIADAGGVTEIRYELAVPDHLVQAERLLLMLVGQFAAGQGDEGWARRYELGVGSSLLGIIPGRLARGTSMQRDVAAVAFGEGLRAMALGCRT